MAFYLGKERELDVVGAYNRYQQYLLQNRDRFPAGAFALATAAWYQDPADHRCPHDSWLEEIIISECAGDDGSRATSIRTRLKGAYHDGNIEFFYPKVFMYRLDSQTCTTGLGDWRYDEFRVTETGSVIHEIEWTGNPNQGETAHWIITASDVQFRWDPQSERASPR